MHRTLPATEQLQQIESRIRILKDNVIESVKDSQILRSNFTSLLHANKETNDVMKNEILDVISSVRNEFLKSVRAEEENVKDIEKELYVLNIEKRSVHDGILLLNKRIREIEEDFGVFHGEEQYEEQYEEQDEDELTFS
ncbi:hypothetical protein SteCoe_606 [Stentor coeruleus]|uniref:Uncharacterized protein n=1 Tax=Stentor coeruleus TaxID=5963 RepID=A0A1R2D3R1_9CILI|nr:hypothetical protein SteCoe_606 [Stentor coeruleus]